MLTVEKPVDGLVEQENYSLPPENFHLPAIEFTDQELAALRTALQLLDGEFAYAEPLRLALQQISWGRPSPLDAPAQRTVALGITGSAGGHELSIRLAKIETAIFRRKTILFDYHTMERDAVGTRKVDPYQLLYQGGQFYLVGRSHERGDPRVPAVTDPGQGRLRDQGRARLPASRQLRSARVREPDRLAVRRPEGVAEVWISDRIAWQVERHFGHYGEIRPAGDGEDRMFMTPYANARQLIAWTSGSAPTRGSTGPPELVAELRERVGRLLDRHSGEPQIAEALPATRPRPTSTAGALGTPSGADEDEPAGPRGSMPRSARSGSPGSSRSPAS